MKETTKMLVFDLDGTLAESKTPMTQEMADVIHRLLEDYDIGVISGGKWGQFLMQFVEPLGDTQHAHKLYLLPTSGALGYRHDGDDWGVVYENVIPEDRRKELIERLYNFLDEVNHETHGDWGEIIEDRKTQITISALGQKAPYSEKKLWDPTKEKRMGWRAMLLPEIEAEGDLDIRLGGTTSLDFTMKGLDKAFGMQKLVELTGHQIDDMVFIGDDLQPGGNDEPVKKTGVRTIDTDGAHHTLDILKMFL